MFLSRISTKPLPRGIHRVQSQLLHLEKCFTFEALWGAPQCSYNLQIGTNKLPPDFVCSNLNLQHLKIQTVLRFSYIKPQWWHCLCCFLPLVYMLIFMKTARFSWKAACSQPKICPHSSAIILGQFSVKMHWLKGSNEAFRGFENL